MLPCRPALRASWEGFQNQETIALASARDILIRDVIEVLAAAPGVFKQQVVEGANVIRDLIIDLLGCPSL
jgi:hypothetical protein